MSIALIAPLFLATIVAFANEDSEAPPAPDSVEETTENPEENQAPPEKKPADSTPESATESTDTTTPQPVVEKTEKKAKSKGMDAALSEPAEPAVMLYNGDISVAMSRVVSATKLSSDSFRSVMITEIAGGEPIIDGPGGLEVCKGATADGRSLRNALKKVRRDISYVKYEDADNSLRTATTYLNCLTDPLIGLDAADLYFMKGFLDFALGRQGLAQESFRRALVFDPEMEWDNNFPPNAIELFQAAQTERESAERVNVRLLPIPAEGSAWLDGVPLRAPDGVIEVLPGAHLIQFSVPQVYTVSLYVKPHGEVSITLPALMPNRAVAWVNDDEQRKDLGVLLGAILAEEKSVYVSSAGEVWRFTPATYTWEQLEVPDGFFAADPERMGRYYASQALFWSGAVAVATGGSFGLISVNSARQAQQEYNSAIDYLPREEARAQYNLSRSNTYAGLGIFLAGAALTGTSFAIQIEGQPRLVPQWRPGSGSMTLQVPLR